MQALYKYINHLANSQRRLIEKLSLDRDYSGAQGKVIHFLFCNTDRVIHQKDIEKEFGMRASTVAEMLRTMEQKGVIHRITSREDARYREIQLTQRAEQYKEAVFSDMEVLQQTLTDGIGEEDLKIWAKVSEKMLENYKGVNHEK